MAVRVPQVLSQTVPTGPGEGGLMPCAQGRAQGKRVSCKDDESKEYLDEGTAA